MNSSDLTTATTVVAVDDALSTTIDGETVILHPDVGEYYGLNEVGSFVWERLQEPRSIEELCREVVDAYGVDLERCRPDVKDLLVGLVERDLVRLTDA